MTSAENALFVNLLVHELRYSTLAQRSKGNFYGKSFWYIHIYIYIYNKNRLMWSFIDGKTRF